MLALERWEDQRARWPAAGKHLLAQYDDETLVVYQAYKPSIGEHAARHGRFGADFSFSRMTWIKPSFLWMMFRSGWGTKKDQEVTLAIRVRRAGFDEILASAVASSFGASGLASEDAWRRALDGSDVRVQWDPDHDPSGRPVERRAIQIGLAGKTLRRFDAEHVVSIEDVSPMVAKSRGVEPSELLTPAERAYPLSDALKKRLGAS